MKIPDDLSITLLSKETTSSKSAKNLGVFIDCNLTYDEHVTQLTSKCISSLCQINRVKYLFDRRTLITIINPLVFSKLLYCSSVWANTTKKNIENMLIKEDLIDVKLKAAEWKLLFEQARE